MIVTCTVLVGAGVSAPPLPPPQEATSAAMGSRLAVRRKEFKRGDMACSKGGGKKMLHHPGRRVPQTFVKTLLGERTPAALPYCSMKVSYSSRLSWRVSSTMPVHSVTNIEPAKPYP